MMHRYTTFWIACVFLSFVFQVSTPVPAGFFTRRNVFVSSFQYQLCDENSYLTNPAIFWGVTIESSEDGSIEVSGTLMTDVNLTAPISASVSLQRRILGLYVPVPCVKEFGSCDYPDLCNFGSSEQCPRLFDMNDVPCNCPIEPGIYTLPPSSFPTPKTKWAALLVGQYRGVIEFYDRDGAISCYKFLYNLN